MATSFGARDECLLVARAEGCGCGRMRVRLILDQAVAHDADAVNVLDTIVNVPAENLRRPVQVEA